ncbi:MAG: SDR family NAD(P)-dependent oxidoreductase [Hyphomicrobiales bacterium]|nr:SDR family NAD(P)-dependent oxidoreductase [Hyphomicrobiales bacterium]
MTWSGKSVLVTGAGGFIGSHLAERLTAEGARVRALVHYNALGSAGWLGGSDMRGDMEVLFGDVTDSDFMRGAVRGCDAVFHLAALIGIPYSYHAPRSYVRTNVEGTLNLLEAARDGGVGRLVHTSTSEVYGSALSVPIAEDHPLQGQSPYSASKIGADKMAEAYHRAFALPVVTLRPFNTFGPRQSARAVIPTIITQALAGAVVRLGNLAPTRDFTFVADTVDGLVRAGSVPGIEGRTIHLGTGREISIGDLVGLVGAALGRDLAVEGEAGRARPADSEVDRLLSDNALARELLGWAPATSLEQGIALTAAWIRDNAGRYRAGTYAV